MRPDLDEGETPGVIAENDVCSTEAVLHECRITLNICWHVLQHRRHCRPACLVRRHMRYTCMHQGYADVVSTGISTNATPLHRSWNQPGGCAKVGWTRKFEVRV